MGVPALFQPMRDVFAHVFPASILVDSGIPVPDFEHFVATPEGSKKIKHSSSVMLVQKGSILFVPAGHMLTFVFVDAQSKSGGKSSSAHAEIASLVLVPLPIKKLIKEMQSNVRVAPRSWFADATREKKTRCGKIAQPFFRAPCMLRQSEVGTGSAMAHFGLLERTQGVFSQLGLSSVVSGVSS